MVAMASLAFAAPRFFAAQSAVENTANDLAVVAAVQREAAGMQSGELPGFPPLCLTGQCAVMWDAMLADLGAVGVQADVAGYYTNTAKDIAGGGAATPCDDPLGVDPLGVDALGVDGNAVQIGLVATWGADDWATAQTQLEPVELGAFVAGDPWGAEVSAGNIGGRLLDGCPALYDLTPGNAASTFWGHAERTYFGAYSN